MKKIGLILLFCIVAVFCAADIPADVALKTYSPSFGDWVFVYFQAVYAEGTDFYSLSVNKEMEDDKVRFIFSFTYFDESQGERIRFGTVPYFEERLEEDCKRWTGEGYPISMNDISIEVEFLLTGGR